MMFRYSNQNKSGLIKLNEKYRQYNIFMIKYYPYQATIFHAKKAVAFFSRQSLQMHEIILTLYGDMHLLGFALSLLRRKVFVEKLIFVVVKCFEKN